MKDYEKEIELVMNRKRTILIVIVIVLVQELKPKKHMIKTYTQGSKISQDNQTKNLTTQSEPKNKKTRRKNKFKIKREPRIARININRLTKNTSLESLLMMEKIDLALLSEAKLKDKESL